MLNQARRNLAQAVDELGVTGKLSRYQMQVCWPELVGSTLAQHSQPQRLQGRTLWVLTRAPAWSQELMMQQSAILEALARRFPKLKLEQLRCRVGTLRQTAPPPPVQPPEDLSAIELPASVEYRLARLTEEVRDPQLRDSMLRALRQKERRDLWLRQQGALACRECGALQDLRTCRGCRQERRRQRRQQLFQLLGRQPWLNYQEAADQLPHLRQGEFHTARRQLLSILLLNYYQERAVLTEGQPLPGGLRHLLLEICMLSTNTPWDQLTDRHVRYSLGRTWAKAYLEDRAPAPYDKTRARKPRRGEEPPVKPP